jgi:ribonuclease-3
MKYKILEGFSLLTHEKIEELPTCKVIRFNIEYTILYVEEKMPENFTIKELDLFCKYCNFNYSMIMGIYDYSLIFRQLFVRRTP